MSSIGGYFCLPRLPEAVGACYCLHFSKADYPLFSGLLLWGCTVA